MWSSDHFGWPITARPFAATSTRQFVEVSEVMNQMVRRACLFRPAEVKKPTVRTTTTTTTATTPNGSFANSRAKSVEKEKDDVLKEPVQAASDLVSLISNFLERS